MPERIKLNEGRIFPVASGEPTHWGLHIFDENNSKESCEQIRAQILDDYNTWNLVDIAFGKTATITDILNLIKENKELKEELDIYKSKKIDVTKTSTGGEIKNKHAYCIYIPRNDLWVEDSYQNLINLNKLQYSEQELKENNKKLTKLNDTLAKALAEVKT